MAHGATIRTGLIGYGLAGRAFHAPLIAAVAGLDLVAIASSRAEEIARDWPGMRTADADAIIAGPDIDPVVIATPTPTHAPLSSPAIAAGKQVVTAKPLALAAGAGSAERCVAKECVTSCQSRWSPYPSNKNPN